MLLSLLHDCMVLTLELMSLLEFKEQGGKSEPVLIKNYTFIDVWGTQNKVNVKMLIDGNVHEGKHTDLGFQ